MKKNIAFTWWWTGWHVFPIKTIIERIKEEERYWEKINNIFWIWEKNSLEEKIANKIEWIIFIDMISWKRRREKEILSLFKNIIDLFKFTLWILKSIYIIKKNNIDIIFCKWWYVALPSVIAWWLLKKEILLHESDTIPWLTNKIASKFSTRNFLGYPDSIKPWVNVWQILSKEIISYKILSENEKEKYKNNLWINNADKKTNVLIMWGSQWASTIYKSILNIAKESKYIKENYNLYIILWTSNIELKNEFDKIDPNKEYINTYEFLNQKEIWILYNISDIAITRWWATSLAEQKLFWIKLIIIPLPFTWWNHQYYNWKYYEENYFDILINQDEKMEVKIKENFEKFKWYKKEEKDIEYNLLNINIDKIIEEIIK